MTKTYRVTWKLEFDADDDEEARAKHMAALKAMDEAPCSVWIQGDGPVEVPASLREERTP